jgi:ACR3 family arsenite transporter
MGNFEKFLSLWVALAIGVGVGLGLLVPAGFELVSQLELARVNLVVAAGFDRCPLVSLPRG